MNLKQNFPGLAAEPADLALWLPRGVAVLAAALASRQVRRVPRTARWAGAAGRYGGRGVAGYYGDGG